ncbi:MAG TPA: hypothetical protein ENJ35_05470 [Gammaproteobacteria bacterium]|nr:hypothetical protein [Gammaproteobacteria bacterium]
MTVTNAQNQTAQHEILMRGWLESYKPGKNPDAGGLIRVRGDNTIREAIVPKRVTGVEDIPTQSIVEVYGYAGEGDEPAIATDIEVLNRAEALPVDLRNIELSNDRYRHLHLRTPKLRAALMFRHFVQKYAREFLESRGYFHVHTPILTEASCVCSGDVFTFPYYNKKIATLIQSPWMYADSLVGSLEKVYALNPSFRREREPTTTHLVEIWQLQVDGAWETNETAMTLEEEFIRYMANMLRSNHADLYSMAGLSMAHLNDFEKSYPRITYDESVKRIRKLGFEMEYGDDFDDDALHALGKEFGSPFFVTTYPKRLKNFWFPQLEENPELTPSNDLFSHTGQGEIIGGGERVNSADQLASNLEYYGHDLDEFDWFLETRKYGCVPHAGFSVGFDRLTAMLMGVDHINKATVYPRLPQGGLRP